MKAILSGCPLWYRLGELVALCFPLHFDTMEQYFNVTLSLRLSPRRSAAALASVPNKFNNHKK